jgi:serine/threonine protein kinase
VNQFSSFSLIGFVHFHIPGTYPYIAPEVYNCERFVPQSDVYAIGIILWEMANRVIKGKYEKPFSEYKQFQFDFQILIQVSTSTDSNVVKPTRISSTHNHTITTFSNCISFLMVRLAQ